MYRILHEEPPRLQNYGLLPPANEVWGKVIFSEACVKNSVHSGACMAGGVCVAGGACMAGGHAWWRDMCGNGACMVGVMHGRGACMAGGHAWWGGMHGGGHAW